jgi:hypothetical protein
LYSVPLPVVLPCRGYVVPAAQSGHPHDSHRSGLNAPESNHTPSNFRWHLSPPHIPLVIFIYFRRLIIFANNADGISSRGRELMRTLLIGALCAILIGCSCPVPPRGVVETCTSPGCNSRTAANTPTEPKRVSFKPEPPTMTVKLKKASISTKPTAAKPENETGPVEGQANSRTTVESAFPPSTQLSATPDPVPKNATTTIGGKTERPASDQSSERSGPVQKSATTTIGRKAEGAASDQPSETPDPVLKKAKITVAAKMEDPASVEFVDIKRAMDRNTFGQTFEIICGRVKGKKKSGEAGERPFLYLVKEDEAFIVGANPDSMAAIAYRAHCISANSH